MAKVLTCREVGMDCDFVARGNSEEEILAQAVVHAQKDHGFTSIPPEVIEKVKAAIHDE
jgi:predicted small metal-binding protein